MASETPQTLVDEELIASKNDPADGIEIIKEGIDNFSDVEKSESRKDGSRMSEIDEALKNLESMTPVVAEKKTETKPKAAMDDTLDTTPDIDKLNEEIENLLQRFSSTSWKANGEDKDDGFKCDMTPTVEKNDNDVTQVLSSQPSQEKIPVAESNEEEKQEMETIQVPTNISDTNSIPVMENLSFTSSIYVEKPKTLEPNVNENTGVERATAEIMIQPLVASTDDEPLKSPIRRVSIEIPITGASYTTPQEEESAATITNTPHDQASISDDSSKPHLQIDSTTQRELCLEELNLQNANVADDGIVKTQTSEAIVTLDAQAPLKSGEADVATETSTLVMQINDNSKQQQEIIPVEKIIQPSEITSELPLSSPADNSAITILSPQALHKHETVIQHVTEIDTQATPAADSATQSHEQKQSLASNMKVNDSATQPQLHDNTNQTENIIAQDIASLGVTEQNVIVDIVKDTPTESANDTTGPTTHADVPLDAIGSAASPLKQEIIQTQFDADTTTDSAKLSHYDNEMATEQRQSSDIVHIISSSEKQTQLELEQNETMPTDEIQATTTESVPQSGESTKQNQNGFEDGNKILPATLPPESNSGSSVLEADIIQRQTSDSTDLTEPLHDDSNQVQELGEDASIATVTEPATPSDSNEQLIQTQPSVDSVIVSTITESTKPSPFDDTAESTVPSGLHEDIIQPKSSTENDKLDIISAQKPQLHDVFEKIQNLAAHDTEQLNKDIDQTPIIAENITAIPLQVYEEDQTNIDITESDAHSVPLSTEQETESQVEAPENITAHESVIELQTEQSLSEKVYDTNIQIEILDINEYKQPIETCDVAQVSLQMSTEPNQAILSSQQLISEDQLSFTDIPVVDHVHYETSLQSKTAEQQPQLETLTEPQTVEIPVVPTCAHVKSQSDDADGQQVPKPSPTDEQLTFQEIPLQQQQIAAELNQKTKIHSPNEGVRVFPQNLPERPSSSRAMSAGAKQFNEAPETASDTVKLVPRSQSKKKAAKMCACQ